MQLLT